MSKERERSLLLSTLYSRGLQVYNLWNLFCCEIAICATVCSQAILLMEKKFAQVHWLGEGGYLCCQRSLFLGSSPTEFSANSSLLAHAHRHMPKEEFHHHFNFNSRQLTPIKTAAIFYELLKMYYNVTTWCCRRLN